MLALARELRSARVAVTLVVHEHKRLGRGLAPATAAAASRAGPAAQARPAIGGCA
ncbi:MULTISPECIES: hypothetical protein [unclassified Nonomuraea]|uniref:hypothetical protein n=1 Tax=unclassified Nonomuraea TaxID=2593643 RepID=UPI001377FDAE|nr:MULTISPECIES: hypothetical protein [unclassified Nonomuraea]NBE96729.1 hypothetical protein [Nonomuraea sp. K271]